MIRRLFLVLMTLLTLPLAGAGVASAQPGAQAGAQAAPTAPESRRESYVLGRGDVVEVSVLGRTDYVSRVQIQDDGTILLPLINAVPAASRTVLELRDQIAAALKAGGYFANPAVNVAVVSFASRYVTVLGQVTTPGVVPIDRAYRLSEIIARAGGVKDASVDAITLTRIDGQSRELSLREIATAGPAEDPLVGDGDKVFVAPSKTFYIYGQVNAPGIYAVERGMSIRMALARGGGLTALGSEKRVKLIRGETETRVKLTEPINPGDVLVVGERFF